MKRSMTSDGGWREGFFSIAQPDESDEAAGPRACPDAACSACGTVLDLMQPDPNRGEYLLGVCGECPAWYLIHEDSGRVFDLGLANHLASRG